MPPKPLGGFPNPTARPRSNRAHQTLPGGRCKHYDRCRRLSRLLRKLRNPMSREQSLRATHTNLESKSLAILSFDAGAWVLELPPKLRPDQPELESMLGKVFSGRRSSPDNLALAQQLSLNWCMSKAKSHGISFEDCFI